MPLRYFRRIHIAPGLSVNLSKSGPSLSLGVRGAHVTVGSKGVRKTVGLPGSGVFYTSQHGWHSGVHTSPEFATGTPEPTWNRKVGGTTEDGLATWTNAGHTAQPINWLKVLVIVAALIWIVSVIASGFDK